MMVMMAMVLIMVMMTIGVDDVVDDDGVDDVVDDDGDVTLSIKYLSPFFLLQLGKNT